MTNDPLTEASYLREQYRDGTNLDARIALNARFSTARKRWTEWAFEHLDLAPYARVLEIGCGTGLLWDKNRARIPPSWRLTLSDFSLGMVETTRGIGLPASFTQNDAQALPFPDDWFDAVVANHMLCHVPDLPRTLAEIKRVLKSGGRLFAATNGNETMREYYQLVAEFIKRDIPFRTKQFTLENGGDQLARYFCSIQRFDYEDSLNVTEAEPIVAYVLSGPIGDKLVEKRRVQALRQFVGARIARDGALKITKAAGLFVATKE